MEYVEMEESRRRKGVPPSSDCKGNDWNGIAYYTPMSKLFCPPDSSQTAGVGFRCARTVSTELEYGGSR